jgi:hypothetical protein
MNAWGRRTARIVTVLVLAAAVLAGRGAPRASADANCTDFATQAAAPSYYIARGGPAPDPDGLDADHDGIACESRPCRAAPPPHVRPPPRQRRSRPRPDTGSDRDPDAGSDRSADARPRLLPAACRRAPQRRLPSQRSAARPRLHPGRALHEGHQGRHLRRRLLQTCPQRPASVNNAVYNAYGITKHFNGRTGEVDHLVSLELGGSNDRANLFPEAASPRPGSHDKDKRENACASCVRRDARAGHGATRDRQGLGHGVCEVRRTRDARLATVATRDCAGAG